MRIRLTVSVLLMLVNSSLFSQIGHSPLIESVKNQCTQQTLSRANKQLSGDTICMIGGTPYTIQSRYWGNAGNNMAAQFIYEQFQSYGLNTYYMSFNANGRNVYAVKTGTKYPNRKYIICSHFDDMPSGSLAPGADDNGSGTCAVLEAARLLAPFQFDYTIVFIAFDEEERGLYGSHAYADTSYFRGDSILAVFNYDMIAYDGNYDKQLNLISNTNSTSFTDNVRTVFNIYSPSLIAMRIVNNNMSSSDHWYFWQRGYKAFCGIEDMSDMTPYYHTVNDNFANLKMDFFLPFTQAAIAALMTFGWDFLMTIEHTPIVSNNNTTPQTAVAVIRSPNPVARNSNGPRLYYRINSGTFIYVNAYYNNLDTFMFQIPGQPYGTSVSYYIAAQDSLGRFVATLPSGGTGISPPGTNPPANLFTYSVLTAIAENQQPVKFQLGQNYPNPFNSMTDVKLVLPKRSHIKLTVADVLGRVVLTAADGVLPAGENTIRIDAGRLSSGVYFYTLYKETERIDTKKMVLTK